MGGKPRPTTGYSGTPLWKKLGILPGARIRTTNAPPNYLELIGPVADGVTISVRLTRGVDLWHLFATTQRAIGIELPTAMEAIRPAGMIWVSWPKKASGVATDVTEDRIRDLALPIGLVDVKVCAVDDTWSGLKLVIRRELR
jgi:hypothetical protein